jgi:hypothetical protein
MSDFEGRVTEALAAGAVVAIAIPVAVVALDGGDGPGKTPVADDPSTTSPVDKFPGRWETWHDISVRVPTDWQYGNQMSWCANGGSVDQFLVTRPGGVTEMIACTPGSSYGIAFQDIDMKKTDEPFDWPVVQQTGDAWPAHTYVGAHGEAGVLVTVAGPDRQQLLDILATVSTFDPVDPNGCSATDDGGPGMAGEGEVPVCRYDEEGRLVQSERLIGDDAIAAADAVRATPQEDGGNLCDNPDTEYVVMGVEGDRVEVQYAGNSTCADRGVFIEGVGHALTADVLYWALSPGWTGSVDEHVPLPDQLRR